MPDLLIELFSEEIPARMQARAAEDLKKRVTDGLVEAGLTYAGAAAFVTPRRLTLTLQGLLAASPTLREERKGPRVDAPDKAIEGFLRGAGASRDQLEQRDDKKGAVFYALIDKPGRPAAAIVAEVLEQVIRSFPWPKSMRWGTGSLRWVRPLQSILCLLNDEDSGQIVPLEVDGIIAGDQTFGHRFMAPAALRVTGFDDYRDALKRAFVLLDAETRRALIWNDATTQAFASGLEVIEDLGLLAEVAGLVEWPVVLMGEIDPTFLDLPDEVLKTSMKEHQKFFSVRNPKSGKIERFITVANRASADQGATILAGNQKVLSARLADAKFFWENDLRVAKGAGLSVWTQALSNVTFHNKLGSEQARIDRIAGLARHVAPMAAADPDMAEQAARIVKADLSSEMVYEFPELQGIMGRYYAEAAGFPAEISAACEAHYAPLGPSDDVPTAPISVAVALADKLDKLTGFWAIDEKPTGSKDPFALRRAALGVIRLLLENRLNVDLKSVFTRGQADADAEDLLRFFHDRLKVYLRDQGIRHDVIDACIAMVGNDDLSLLSNRAAALSNFLKTDDGENLLQAFKRANNILTQAETKDGVEYSYGADAKYAEHRAERTMFAALDAEAGTIEAAVVAQDFVAALSGIAGLRAPLDGFFEAVQVNDDNAVVRRNRLNLLNRIRSIC
ncbi:MAG: glycine--tRNA ligase subunit beta, partial [Rhodobacterales bacterium]